MNDPRSIKIQGDGNAIGNNNRILVDKRTYAKITHQHNYNNDRGDKSDGSSLAIALPIASLIAIAVAAWKFALYAHVIYAPLIFVSFLLALSQGLALTVAIVKDVNWAWRYERTFGLLGALLLLIAVYWSRSAYPAELSELASQATSGTDFMCVLTLYGQQVATLHMASICLAAFPCLIFLAINSIGALTASLFFTTGWQWSGQLAIQLGTRWILVVAVFFATIAFISQTSIAAEFWRDAVFTPKIDPFLKKESGFNLCH